jgi:hypothetical protein
VVWSHQNQSHTLKWSSSGPGHLSTQVPLSPTQDTAGNYTCTMLLRNGQAVKAVYTVKLPPKGGENQTVQLGSLDIDLRSAYPLLMLTIISNAKNAKLASGQCQLIVPIRTNSRYIGLHVCPNRSLYNASFPSCYHLILSSSHLHSQFQGRSGPMSGPSPPLVSSHQ